MKTIGVVRAGLVVGAVALAGVLVPVSSAIADDPPAPPSADMMSVNAVPLEQAGEVVAWNNDDTGDGYALPWENIASELDGQAVVQVVSAGTTVLALTAAGKVVAWGADMNRLERVPRVVKDATVVQIAGSLDYAGAVTADGQVLVWGQKSPPGTKRPVDVPEDLPPVRQLALVNWQAVALTRDGQVVAWGGEDGDTAAILEVPEELNTPEFTPVALVAGLGDAYALTGRGTLVGWGASFSSWGAELPATVTVPGSVKAIAGLNGGAIAVLADDTMIAWQYGQWTPGYPQYWTPRTLPVSVTATTPVLLASDHSDVQATVDGDHVVHHWFGGNQPPPGQELEESGLVPEGLDGRPIVGLAVGGRGGGVAIVTKMLRAARPSITGTAKVGGVLSGTAGTFSASPSSVTSRWLVNGVEAGDGPTLTVTAGMAGKKIVYESKATKPGEADISSSSAPVTVPVAPIVKTTPGVVVKVVKAPTGKKAGTATVTVRGGAVATGKVAVTVSGKIKKGKKTKKQTIRLTGVLKNGVASVKVKKIKNAKGTWSIGASYVGDAKHHPAASRPVKFKVKKK